MNRTVQIVGLSLVAFACGKQTPGLHVRPGFEAGVSDSQTQSLLVITRAVNDRETACDDLWMYEPTGLAENRCMTGYPLPEGQNPLVPVALSQYDQLTVLLYTYDSTSVTDTPQAGGCLVQDLEPGDEAVDVTIPLELNALEAGAPFERDGVVVGPCQLD